jgi:hypothetical protein
VQDSDNRALGEFDLESGARDRERITKRGPRRGPKRWAGGGRAVEDLFGLERPPRHRSDTAESETGVRDRAVFDQQRRGRGGERELEGGSAALGDPFTVAGSAFKVELAQRTIVRILQTVSGVRS